MCAEVIFNGRRLHTVEDLRTALAGGKLFPDRRNGYTKDDLMPYRCLCPVDLAKTAAKNGLRLWPSPEGETVWVMADPRKTVDLFTYQSARSNDWTRALRLADAVAESAIRTEGYPTEDRHFALYPEQIADPHMKDCIAHLEWRGVAKVAREYGRVTVIFEEKP